MIQSKSIIDIIGNTPLVEAKNITSNKKVRLFLKLEGKNPGGSVKDRAAFNMVNEALKRGDISKGDTLVEATSGNTGIALAFIAKLLGLNMVLVMPENSTEERIKTMRACGAELIVTPADKGTIMGVSKYLKTPNAAIEIVGAQPADRAIIPGIRKWPEEYLPEIFNKSKVDTIVEVSEKDARNVANRLAKEEGVFAGMSSGGSVSAALKIAETIEKGVIVAIICDIGDRYLSSDLFQ